MPVPSTSTIALLLAILLSIVGAWIWVILRLAFRLPVLPPNTPRIVPWGAGSVLAVVLCWIGLSVLISNVYVAAIQLGPGPHVRRDLTPAEVMTLSAIQNGATLLLVPLLLAATSGARPRDLAGVGEGFRWQVARGMFGYPILAPLVFGAMGLSVWYWGKTNHPLQDAIVKDMSPGTGVILALAAVFFAPAAEELIFRGVLLGWLTRLAIGKTPARADTLAFVGLGDPHEGGPDAPLLEETIVVKWVEGAPSVHPPEMADHPYFHPEAPPTASVAEAPAVEARSPGVVNARLLAANIAVSIVFAGLHAKVWPTPVPIFFLSLGLGFLYQRTGSIIAPLALHMTFNGVSTVLMFLTLTSGVAPKDLPKVPVPAPIGMIEPGLREFAPTR